MPRTSGSLFGVFGCGRLACQTIAVADQEVLQVGASVRVQGIEHLVELDGIGGLRDRDRGARGERPGRRVPGWSSTNQLPSRKMRGRILSVASEWTGSALDSSSMLTKPTFPSRLIELTEPTGYTGDPHGRLRVDVHHRGEDRIQAEAMFARDVFGEAEVADDHDHDHDDHAEAQWVRAVQLRAEAPRAGATSVRRSLPLPLPRLGLGLR